MLIAIVNGQTVEQVGDYQVLFPNTSFPSSGPTDEWMTANSCMYVNTYLPYDQSTQVLAQVAPYISVPDPTKPLEWVYTVKVEQMTPEQQAAYIANLQAQTSATAQQLLSATDWTAIASVADPALSNPYLSNQAAFLSYRSAVRAIGVNPPTTAPVFPPVPTATWQTVTTTPTN
jgi:hypothetical protein